MKNHPVGAELFHVNEQTDKAQTDRQTDKVQTDRQTDMTKPFAIFWMHLDKNVNKQL
jgi:hypothetical protein